MTLATRLVGASLAFLSAAVLTAGCRALLGIDDPIPSDSTFDASVADDVGSATPDAALGPDAPESDGPLPDATSDALASEADRPQDATEGGDDRAGIVDGGPRDARAGDAVDAPPPPPTLYGATANLSIHCCTAPPNSTNLAGSYPAATVGPQVEFPSIGTSNVLDATVDIQSSSIHIGIPTAATSATGGFNGYVFVFSSTPPTTPVIPVVASATLSKSSTIPQGKIVVTFANNADGSSTVEINVAGTAAPANSTLIVDLVLHEPDGG